MIDILYQGYLTDRMKVSPPHEEVPLLSTENQVDRYILILIHFLNVCT